METNKTNTLRCVIFDMDGTLTRTNELIFASFNHVLHKYGGRTLMPEEIIALFGPPEEGGLQKELGAEHLESAMEDLCIYYRTHHGDMAFLHEGIEDVLRFLRESDMKLAVFTGKGRRTASITLDEFRLTRYFDLIVSGDDVVNYKPHHEGIEKILSAFNVAPEQTLMVGDSVADITASRGAGVKVASVLWDSYDKQRVLQAGSDYVFHSVGEMMDWFHRHLN